MKTDALSASSPALVRVVALHAALRLIEAHGAGAPLAPAPADLYRELQAFTPESLQYVLEDLFEMNGTAGRMKIGR
jgi:hypothetical protein